MTTRRNKKQILMLLENCSMPEDTRVRNEAATLTNKGFEVFVISPDSEKQGRYQNFEGIHIYRYPAPLEFGGVLGYAWEFGYSAVVAWLISFYLLLRHGFDAIHVHAPPDTNCVVAIFFKVFASKKYVLDTHDLSPELYASQKGGESSKVVDGLLRWFERQAVQWADSLIATNDSQRDIQVDRGGANREDCYVVRNGPAGAFNDLAAPTTKIDKNGRFVIGYVGIIGVQDGVDMLIKAANHLRTELKREDFLCVIVGDGAAVPMLREMVKTLDLEAFVTFTGMIPYEEVPAYISAFDVCVTPDPSNPYNDSCTTIKTMEYMIQARPVVAFETPENQITAKEAALYASNNSVPELAKLMTQLLDSPELREKMGQHGRTRCLEKLTWGHQEAELIKLYRALFDIRPRKSSPAQYDAEAEQESEQLIVEPPVANPKALIGQGSDRC